MVAGLTEEVQRTTAAELPTITNMVLGSGAHCGDVIETAQLDALEKELDVLATAPVARSHYTDEFLSNMRELIATAGAERNPIYFG